MERAVVVGASHAGAQLAASLRQEGWSGEILVLDEEGGVPYQRPPLSKAYLAGQSSRDDLALRSSTFYTKNDIQLQQASVRSLDVHVQRVDLVTGESLEWDHLALCTGARPRRLDVPGGELENVFYLRNSADVDRIRSVAKAGRRVVIVGAGYIGLETAASLHALGLDVTVLETVDRVLERVTAPEVSAFFERVHRGHGIDLRTQARVVGFAGDDHVREVILAGGESISADLVIIGIGVVPNVELAAAAGLLVDDGIVIDDASRTSAPNVVAAGDCASHHHARYGSRIRLESVPSAGEQAKVAAATMCGKAKSITALPWFWSDQFDLKLQIAGLNTGYDEVVFSGDPATDNDFTCFYLRDGELIAADCVNRPKDFVFSKQAIARNSAVGRSELMAISS